MPAWLARLLPHIGISLAVIPALWWMDHEGYRRAMADRDARDTQMLDQMRRELRQSEQRVAGSIDSIAGNYERQGAAISRTGASLQPIILKETADAPRLSDPAAGLTPGLLDALNRARAAGACAPAASGSIECALPAATAGVGPIDR